MGLKHYKDKPQPTGVEWTCPGCGAKQTGRLELGCTQCGAGTPGKAAASAAPQSILDPTDVEGAYQQYRASFQLRPEGEPLAVIEIMIKKAWMSGYVQATLTERQTAPAGTALPVEGIGGTVGPEAFPPLTLSRQLLVRVVGDAEDNVESVDEVVLATILAALAFYRDNQLVYGAVPGQLTADQVTALLAQLTPTEEEVPA